MKLKIMIRSALFVTGLLLALLALNGCIPVAEPFFVTTTPDSGHPPFAVTVAAFPVDPDKDGSTYTFGATGEASVQSTDSSYQTVIHEWPWKCTVTWNNGDSVAVATAHVALNNVGPTINRPLIDGKSDLWYGVPLERNSIDCRYHEETPLWPGYVPVVTGIKDPDGDSWTLTAISVQCDLLDDPDTLFMPPYRPGVFHADGMDNAVIWYPTYISPNRAIGIGSEWREEKKYKEGNKVYCGNYGYECTKEHTSVTGNKPRAGGNWQKYWASIGGKWDLGLPYPPYPETGYPFDPCLDNNVTFMPSQVATITITAEDQFGASATKSFDIPIGAAGCSK